MSGEELARRACSLRRVHKPHRWWSRRLKCYFACSGKGK